MFISMSRRFQTHSAMPWQENSSSKWRSTQAVEGWSTTTQRSDEKWILGIVMFQYLCVAVVYVGYLLCCILVMFDVMTRLLCCKLRYLICDIGCYVYVAFPICLFWRLPRQGGKQNRQFFLKTFSYVHRLCSLADLVI
jgi:hypothetical protein